MLKISILGCGSIAQVHAAAIAQTEGAALISMADVKPERAAKMAAKYGGTAYDSLDALLAGEKPDILHICTPHYTHTPLAVQALESDVNVLLEKPVGISADEIDLLDSAVRRSGKQLAISFQNRYKETSRRAKALIEAGDCGRLLGARGFVTWRRDERYYTDSGWRGSMRTEGGGVMINQAIHTLDLMLWMVGDPLTVEGHVANHHLRGVIDVEDTAEACMDFGGGVRGLFYATNANCMDSPVYLEIMGEKYNIVLEGETLTRRGHDGTVIDSFTNEIEVTDGKPCWGSSHKVLIQDFYDCVKTGRRFPIGAAEGGRALKALLDIYASSKTGEPVKY